MDKLVTISLDYIVTGDNDKAIADAIASLESSYAPHQGRLECVSGCGPNGNYEAKCIGLMRPITPGFVINMIEPIA